MPSNAQLAFAIRAMNESQKALKDVQGDLQGITDRAEKAHNGIGKFSDMLKTAGSVAAGFLAANAIQAGLSQVTGVIGGAVDAAKDLGESLNAVNVVFGASSQKILQWGKDNATAYGLSSREFNQLVTPLGAMLTNYGFSADEAADQSINLTKRAADMASVFNVDVGEALTAIQAGLRGEADPLEKFGVGLNAAAVEAKALAMTGKDVASSLTDQEKKAASLALIMEQTAKVEGDFVNTSDALANSQRIAAAKTEKLQAQLGEKLLPVTLLVTQAKLKLTEAIVTGVVPAMEWLSAFAEEEVLPVLKDIGEKVMPTLTAAFAQYKQAIEGLIPVAQSILKFFQDNPAAIAAVTAALGLLLIAIFPEVAAMGALYAAGILLLANWDSIRDKVTDLVTDFQDKFPLLWAIVETVFDLIKNRVETTINAVKDIITIVMALIHGDWDKAWNGLKDLVTGLLGGMLTEVQLILGGLVPLLFEAGKQGAQALIDGLKSLLGALSNAAVSLMEEIRKQSVQLPGLLYRHGLDAVKGLAGGLWDGITQFLNSAVNAVIDKINPANWFSTPEEHYRMLFGNAMKGMAEEISKGTTAVAGAASGVIAVLTGSSSGGVAGSGSASGGIEGAILTVRDALEFLRQGMDRSAANVLAYVAGLITLQDALAGIEAAATSAGSAVGSVAGATGNGNLGKTGPIIVGEDPSGKPIDKLAGMKLAQGLDLLKLAMQVRNQVEVLLAVLTGADGTTPISDIVADLNQQATNKARKSNILGWFDAIGLGGQKTLSLLRDQGLSFDRGGWLMPGLTLARNDTGRPERVVPPGGGEVHVHFHGPVMGDAVQARQFARQLKELMLQVA